jgi:lipopolysaccharide transport system ATP-binding protein
MTGKQQEPVLKLSDVGVYYKASLKVFNRKGFWALRNLNFEVYHGETLGVIGKNGAGKSTLLQLMAGIIEPDEGKIIRTSLTSQLLSLQVGFLPHLSGRENAVLSGILLGMRKRDVLGSMDEIIEFSELGEHIDDPVRTYSSGMKARLGFAVARQSDPDILLVDEVLGVGDSRFKEKSKKVMIDRIHSDKTVVLVSHNETTIKDLCDRVIWLDDGETQSIGSSEDVVNSYMGV